MTRSSRTAAAAMPHAASVGDARDLGDSGPEGNTRLTSATGSILLVMLAVEGFTVLDVRGMITLHIYLGLVLLGPVLLKVATTSYRFARYYTGDVSYVRKGPPHIVLRVLGPLVVLSSLALFGTGVALVVMSPSDGLLLTVHQASFIVWVAVMTIHVIGHLREGAVSSWREVRQRSPRQRRRLGLIVLALLAGVGTAAALMPTAAPWINRPHGFEHYRR